METHVRVIGWLFVIMHALGILGGLIVLFVLGGIGAIAGATGGQEALPALPILGGIGAMVCLIMTIASIPGLLAGVGVLRLAQWGRILTLIMAALNILNFPIGTAIGIYAFVILLKPEAAALFDGRPTI